MKYTWLTIGALAASAAVVCGVIFKRRMRAAKSEASGNAQGGEDQFGLIADGISRNAAVFDGLYEGLFQAAQNHTAFFTDAYEEWCDRAEQLNDAAFCTAFAQVFSKADTRDETLCRGKYAALLQCVERAGMIRRHETGKTYSADETMQCAYSVLDGAGEATGIVPGAAYTVLASAWTKGDRVVEHGMVMRVAEDKGGKEHA